MSTLPTLALSVRQPWAWAIIHGGKDVENRTGHAISFMVPLTGRRAIHASKTMTRDEYESARDFMASLGVACPLPEKLLRGGIIGSVEVTGAIRESDSRWFIGPRALTLADPQPCDFVAVAGALGYFQWKSAFGLTAEPPARWMLPQPQKTLSIPTTSAPDLFSDDPNAAGSVIERRVNRITRHVRGRG